MEGKGNISDYRRKLDKTLASPDLTNDEMLQTLVKNQILQSSHFQFEGYIENMVERRSKEVSNFLSMLRSASVNDVERSKSSEDSHSGWKLKQDTEEFRVMYREGPEGTPFHTLLVEGYVDGPLDVCLCISWESGLYKKWWPQTAIPTFKVISSQCLQTVRTGEQISLVRMKVSWPLSSREALMHYFAFEYFQDDLMVVLLNSISDSETIDRRTHGFTRDGIPDADDVVRIDVVGGFALQKVTADRSYFRTIANMDIKLDFVPPAFINFISRQLIGSGFKLYKKEVASVSKGDEKFLDALKDSLYTRIREALYSGNSTGSQDLENLERSTSTMLEAQSEEAFEDDNAKKNNWCDACIIDSEAKDAMFIDRNEGNEIEESEENDKKGSEPVDDRTLKSSNYSTDQITEKFRADKEEFVISSEGEETLRTNKITENYGSEIRKKVRISPEVEQALETLEKVISIFREHNSNPEKGLCGINKINLTKLEKEAVQESMSSEGYQISRKNGNCAESSQIGSQELNSLEPRISVDSHASRETNQSKIVPASPDEDRSSPSNSKQISLHSSMNQKTGSTVFENVTENYPPSADADTINGNTVTKRKNKKSRFCCLHFISE
ncbi:hypothetical protein Pfo_004037 [Paulownia fortunei]|nr:hypothetical protein Pfo_004037 [Paulownia fortunei]